MRRFTIQPCGDPYNRRGWEVSEHEKTFADPICIYRGDLSPIQGKRNTVDTLRRMYPGCRIRVAD